jgi:hypothetical protein
MSRGNWIGGNISKYKSFKNFLEDIGVVWLITLGYIAGRYDQRRSVFLFLFLPVSDHPFLGKTSICSPLFALFVPFATRFDRSGIFSRHLSVAVSHFFFLFFSFSFFSLELWEAAMGGYFSSFFESMSQMFGDASGNRRFLMVGLDNAGEIF